MARVDKQSGASPCLLQQTILVPQFAKLFGDRFANISRVNAESRVPSPPANTTAARSDWDIAIANLPSQVLSSRLNPSGMMLLHQRGVRRGRRTAARPARFRRAQSDIVRCTVRGSTPNSE